MAVVVLVSGAMQPSGYRKAFIVKPSMSINEFQESTFRQLRADVRSKKVILPHGMQLNQTVLMLLSFVRGLQPLPEDETMGDVHDRHKFSAIGVLYMLLKPTDGLGTVPSSFSSDREQDPVNLGSLNPTLKPQQEERQDLPLDETDEPPDTEGEVPPVPGCEVSSFEDPDKECFTILDGSEMRAMQDFSDLEFAATVDDPREWNIGPETIPSGSELQTLDAQEVSSFVDPVVEQQPEPEPAEHWDEAAAAAALPSPVPAAPEIPLAEEKEIEEARKLRERFHREDDLMCFVIVDTQELLPGSKRKKFVVSSMTIDQLRATVASNLQMSAQGIRLRIECSSLYPQTNEQVRDLYHRYCRRSATGEPAILYLVATPPQ